MEYPERRVSRARSTNRPEPALRRSHALALAALLSSLAVAAASATGQEDEPPQGPFGLSRIATRSGTPASIQDFFMSSDCALCHPRQWAELDGAMHSVAHVDPLYRSFAEMARREAGEEVYTYCSGCHSPAGVVTGLIPRVPEESLPAEAKAGVTCDVCHTITELESTHGPWGEPGNASFTMEPGRHKLGPLAEVERNPAHTGERREFFESSEFCASCHTIIHPINGLRIEHTYDEWRKSVYAERGINCQDCHMRSVEDAITVAETLEPVEVRGTAARKGVERSIAPHYFVGGNADADQLLGSRKHAGMAEARLRSAATLEIRAPEAAAPGSELAFEIAVNNVGAGHSLPTSLTELREMWVHVRVLDAAGAVVFESGALDDHGEIPEGTMRFGAALHDADGEYTFKPWEGAGFLWKRQVPAKGTEADPFSASLPAEASAPFTIEARLHYRTAPPHVVEAVMGEEAYEPKIVEMASARVEVGG
jgi:hypothetical protein